MSLLRTIAGLLLLPFVLVAAVIALLFCDPDADPPHSLADHNYERYMRRRGRP